MLLEMRIKNFAIIDEMNIAFGGGLNVITGETGAGKSIIIGALSLLLGERASVDLIRGGEDTLTVEGIFDISNFPALRAHLESIGCDDSAELVARRIISRSGKNRIYIGGAAMPLGSLAEITEGLVAICSQHEHQVLLRAENHVDVLDEFGSIVEARRQYATIFEEAAEIRERRDKIKLANEQRRQREDFLRYQIEEINAANLIAGEDAALAAERLVLANIQKLSEHTRNALSLLYLEGGSAMERIKNALADVQAIAKIDTRFDIQPENLESIFYQIEDIAASLRAYEGGLIFSPERLTEIDERMELIKRLKRKHGGELSEIIVKREEITAELGQLAALDDEIAVLDEQIAVLESELMSRAADISIKRKTAAKGLKSEVEREIAALKLSGAIFEVIFRETKLTAKGGDGVEFYLSTNIGEQPKPLSNIASGGELSRIALAIRSALAKADVTGTIVFDEVDSGIGGAVASLVGEKIAKMARNRQVVCITHLPQIACFAQRHFAVSKIAKDGQTSTSIRALDKNESTDEIARMLSGKEMTAITREHAREMLETAKSR